jgi:glutamate/tyrosine decarboxylase-like PLP-dependent enzyme
MTRPADTRPPTEARSRDASPRRDAPLALDLEVFRTLGHRLVDDLADRLSALAAGPVTRGGTPEEIRAALGASRALPDAGTDPAELLARATRLVFEHGVFNGHPKFFGYITASPAPIGMLGDLLGAAANPNLGGWLLSPIATEIELQTVRWISQLIGFPDSAGGLLVSGGNMANFAGFWAARTARAPWNIRVDGASGHAGGRLRAYCSAETHTWIEKASDLSGLGTSAVRWIPTDAELRMDVDALVRQIDADREAGDTPFFVVGTAGSVSTGAVDPLPAIARVCRDRGLWFHVDGAYGGFAAAVEDAPADLRALREADSVAVDPHKWLYAPLEAGCALVRDPAHLRAAFSYHPPYYHFDDTTVNLVDYGPQNSRGFRALKVWLAMQQAGAAGYRRMIGDDMRLARRLADSVAHEPELELATQALSITTFRYIPPDLRGRAGEDAVARYLDELNEAVLDRLQRGGEAFVSNAVIRGRYLLRACIVNIHTDAADVDALPSIVVRTARAIDARLRPAALAPRAG